MTNPVLPSKPENAQTAGERLAFEFLARCQDEGVTGVGIFNAAANVLIATFSSIAFEKHADRMAEFDKYCADLRVAINTAGRKK